MFVGVVLSGLLVGCHSDAEVAESTKPESKALAAATAPNEGLTASVNTDDKDGKAALNLNINSKGVKFSASDGSSNEVNFSASDKNVSVDVKGDGNSLKNNVEISESEVGLKFYPGSTSVPVASMHAAAPDEEVWIATRSTPDSAQQVNAFYANALHWDKSKSEDNSGETKIELIHNGKDGEEMGVSIQRSKDSKNTSVSLTRKIKRKQK